MSQLLDEILRSTASSLRPSALQSEKGVSQVTQALLDCVQERRLELKGSLESSLAHLILDKIRHTTADLECDIHVCRQNYLKYSIY